MTSTNHESVVARFGPRGSAAEPKKRMTSWVVPTALGHGYDTAFGAWLTCTGRKGRSEETQEMERGKVIEKVLIEWGADKLGLELVPSEYRLHDNGWSGDFVDCLYADPKTGEVQGVAEAKTVAQGAVDKWGTPGTDEVPTYTLIQAQWHLYHYPEVDTVYVPVMKGGYRFVIDLYKIRRDEAFLARIVEDAQAWWKTYVVTDTPPELSAGDTEWLNARHPRADKESFVDVTDNLIEAVAVRAKYDPIIKRAKELCDAANNRIRLEMGSCHKAKHDNFSVTWGDAAESRKTDYEALFVDLCQQHKIGPEAQLALVEKHSKVALANRRLTVTCKGDWKRSK